MWPGAVAVHAAEDSRVMSGGQSRPRWGIPRKVSTTGHQGIKPTHEVPESLELKGTRTRCELQKRSRRQRQAHGAEAAAGNTVTPPCDRRARQWRDPRGTRGSRSDQGDG